MKKIIFNIFIYGSVIILIFVAFFLFYCLHDAPKLESKKLYESKTCRIYDKNNVLIQEIGEKRQEWISYNNISDNMITALISVEDSRFFVHNGIDYQRMLKATINNIKALNFLEGASTINQQLIKNAFLTNEKTIKRKVQEIYLAIILDNKLSKEQILEAYLNSVLFGSSIYGVERASKYYFNHSAKDLSISEAALLAGILQLPNYYDPLKNYEEAKKRRNLVIELMAKNGFISEEEKISASNEEIVLDNNIIPSKYASYIDYVIYEAANVHDMNLFSKEINIYTAMDPIMQDKIDNIMNTNNYLDENLKTGIVCLDNSGLIEAIGGIKNNIALGLNYATEVRLQPGSTIKPILDYGPAFEYLNYGTGTMILDDTYSYSDGTRIKNWDSLFFGNITMRQALANSRNIPALKLFQQLGSLSFQFASKLGIEQNEPIYESHALGGFSIGYTVLEMTNAYLGFANMGVYRSAQAIVGIDNKKVINKEIVAMKESTAFMINDILHGVINGSIYNVNGMYIMAKTGQTNYNYETRIKYNIPYSATKDSWMIGYTSDKTVGVWCGYDDYNYYLDNNKKNIPRFLFRDIMRVYSPYSPMTYKAPDTLVRVLILKGYEIPYLARYKTYNTSYEYFIKGTEPYLFSPYEHDTFND